MNSAPVIHSDKNMLHKPQKLRDEPRHALDCYCLCDGHHSRKLLHLQQS
jgi:hypothetical protein